MSDPTASFFLYRDFLYRDVIECMTSGVVAFRAERDPATGTIVDFRWILSNAYAEKVHGRPETEVVGKRLLEELPEHKPSGLFDRYVRVVETGEPEEFVTAYNDKGVRGVFNVRAVKMGDGVAVAFTDVTAETSRRDAYESVANRLSVATAAAGIGVWERNVETDEAMWDETTRQMFGIPLDEPPAPNGWRNRVHPDDLPFVEGFLNAALESDGVGPHASFRVRFRVIHPDGSVHHLESNGRLMKAEGGRRLVGVNMDVTAEAERQIAFETLADRFAVATSAADIGVWERDADTHAVIWDDITRRIYGIPADATDLVERWRGMVHPDDRARVEAAVAAASNGDPASREAALGLRFRITRPDGALRYVQSHAKLVVVGSRRRLVGVNWDVTNEVEAARELDLKRREAEAANVAKSQFLAVMSHEIRTPLNGVLGMAALLAQTQITDSQRKMLDTIRESGDELLEILNSILDLSRIEAGRLEIEENAFSLDHLVRRAATLFEPQAADKGLAFRVVASRAAHGGVVGDSTRIRQVLHNLLSNAVKFTSVGEVVLSTDLRPRPDGKHELVFAVRDTGVGIPADKLKRIFEPFTQADGSTTRRFGGAGLGLSIAAQLAEVLGGSIAVESKEGEGSTFTVSFAVKRAELEVPTSTPAAAPVLPSKDKAPALRVLAAEDSHTNQLVLRGMLRACGADATIVENGLKAIEAWVSGGYDLILMDIQMPVMDGVAAAREIRRLEAESFRVRTPIIAVSANAMPHQVEAYLAAGMDAHIAKPIDPRELVQAIRCATLEPTDVSAEGLRPASARTRG